MNQIKSNQTVYLKKHLRVKAFNYFPNEVDGHVSYVIPLTPGVLFDCTY